MSATDVLLAQAEYYAAAFAHGRLHSPPALGVTVLACMDARLNIYGLLGLAEGDAHVLRNAGGIATQDTLRSLAISQRKLGTREVIVIQHTGCGMATFTDDDFRSQIARETGVRPLWSTETFTDVDANVAETIARITADPAIPHTDSVRGFVYDVHAGSLREVLPVAAPGHGHGGGYGYGYGHGRLGRHRPEEYSTRGSMTFPA